MLTPILAGAVLGALYAILARRRGPAGECGLFALGLAVAAVIYVALVAPDGDGRWLALELVGVVLFGAVAWVGRNTTTWLALGWLAHVGWDVGLHLDRAQSVVGQWYPLVCIGFDLVVAGFLLDRALSPARSGKVTTP